MANLTRRFAFKRWVPDIGNNRELPPKEQLALELAVHLTKEQVDELQDALGRVPAVDFSDLEARFNAATSDEEKRSVDRESTARMLAALTKQRTDAFGEYVRIVGGPHTINGAPLDTVGDFMAFAATARDGGVLLVAELMAATLRFNSLAGGDELFSPRRSGGSASTGTPSVVKDSAPTAAR